MDLMYISLSLIIGFVLGIAVAYVVVTKFSSKHKIQDELTRSRREMANSKRMLDEFLVNSSGLFAQLAKSFVAYAHYMEKSVGKLSPDAVDLYSVDLSALEFKEDNSRRSLKESLLALQDQVANIAAAMEEESTSHKSTSSRAVTSDKTSGLDSAKDSDKALVIEREIGADAPSVQEDSKNDKENPAQDVKSLNEKTEEYREVNENNSSLEIEASAKELVKVKKKEAIKTDIAKDDQLQPKDFAETEEPQKI